MTEERTTHLGENSAASEFGQAYAYVPPELLTGYHDSQLYLFAKRVMDILLSTVAIFVLSPFLLLVALAIYIDDPKGSPIFVQDRIGKNGKSFQFFKSSFILNRQDICWKRVILI